MRKLFIVCLLILLAGCTSMAKQLNGSLEPPAGFGYAIFALTGQAFEPDTASTSINWQSTTSVAKGTLWANLNVNTIFGGKEYGMSAGKLQLLDLPAGDYIFTNAYASWMEESGIMRYREMQTYPLNLPFSIKAGEVVYLGDVYLDMSYRPEAKILDSHLRDFVHIQRIWKIQDTSIIKIRLLSN